MAPEPCDASGKPTKRPSIFFPQERAKWDAWRTAGTTWRDNTIGAEARYIEIATSMGWPGVRESVPVANMRERSPSPSAEELLAQESDDEKPIVSGTAFGNKVSTMRPGNLSEKTTLHDLAMDCNAEDLTSFLEANPSLIIDGFDEYVSQELCMPS